MAQWVIWFNVMSFTLMFAAFAFSFLGYLSDRKAWLRSYLLYFASYAFWLLLATYFSFRMSFLPADRASLDIGIGWIRVGVSLLIAYVAPLLVIQLEAGKASVRALCLLGITPLIILAGAVGYTVSPKPWVAGLLNISFNGFLLAVSARGVVVLRKALPDPRAASLRAFFRLSIVLYALAIGYSAVARVVRSAIVPASNTILTGVFGLAWSLLVIVDQVRKTKSQDLDGLPSFFLTEYRITAREASIIQLLSDGKTTKEIGARLFVSHRTVETHTRNIYRKCGASNRVELINLIDSCRKR